MSKQFPTEEVWNLRAATRPDTIAATLDKLAARREAWNCEQREREEVIIAARQKRRAAFEAAVAASLSFVNAEWLAEYRVPDCDMPGDFDGAAMFKPEAIALWPIRLELEELPTTDDTLGCWVGGYAPWIVFLPSGQVSFGRFDEALEVAATYRICPF